MRYCSSSLETWLPDLLDARMTWRDCTATFDEAMSCWWKDKAE